MKLRQEIIVQIPPLVLEQEQTVQIKVLVESRLIGRPF